MSAVFKLLALCGLLGASLELFACPETQGGLSTGGQGGLSTGGQGGLSPGGQGGLSTGGQGGLSTGGLRIANALGHGQGALKVEIDGRPWSVNGLLTGEVSGLRRVKPGAHRMLFSREGLESIELRLVLKPGEILTLVPYVQPRDEEQLHRLGAAGFQIRVLKLGGFATQVGRSATVIDVGYQERRLLEIKQLGKSWQPLALKRMELQRFGIVQHRGYLPMRVGKQVLSSMPVFEDGHHVIVLYELPSGRMASLCFRDRSWPPTEATEP